MNSGCFPVVASHLSHILGTVLPEAFCQIQKEGARRRGFCLSGKPGSRESRQRCGLGSDVSPELAAWAPWAAEDVVLESLLDEVDRS